MTINNIARLPVIGDLAGVYFVKNNETPDINGVYVKASDSVAVFKIADNGGGGVSITDLVIADASDALNIIDLVDGFYNCTGGETGLLVVITEKQEGVPANQLQLFATYSGWRTRRINLVNLPIEYPEWNQSINQDILSSILTNYALKNDLTDYAFKSDLTYYALKTDLDAYQLKPEMLDHIVIDKNFDGRDFSGEVINIPNPISLGLDLEDGSHDSSFINTNFQFTNIESIWLRLCNLTNANFTNAIFPDSNYLSILQCILNGANFENAINLPSTPSDLDTSLGFNGTVGDVITWIDGTSWNYNATAPFWRNSNPPINVHISDTISGNFLGVLNEDFYDCYILSGTTFDGTSANYLHFTNCILDGVTFINTQFDNFFAYASKFISGCDFTGATGLPIDINEALPIDGIGMLDGQTGVTWTDGVSYVYTNNINSVAPYPIWFWGTPAQYSEVHD